MNELIHQLPVKVAIGNPDPHYGDPGPNEVGPPMKSQVKTELADPVEALEVQLDATEVASVSQAAVEELKAEKPAKDK